MDDTLSSSQDDSTEIISTSETESEEVHAKAPRRRGGNKGRGTKAPKLNPNATRGTGNPHLDRFMEPFNDPRRAEKAMNSLLSKRLVKKRPPENASWLGSNFRIRTKSKLDWKDSDLMGRPKVALKIWSAAQVCKFGEAVLRSFSHAGCQQAIAILLGLAWNLRAPQTYAHIFPSVDPTSSFEDLPPRDFSTREEEVMKSSLYSDKKTTDDPYVLAAGYSYFAASLLRLATKPAQNYLNAFKNIKDSFIKFYDIPFPLRSLRVNLKFLEFVRTKLGQMGTLRNSLSGFLYLHETIEDHVGLRRFLYEIHLSCTGMHVYNLSVKLLSALKVDRALLFDCIRVEMFDETLKELSYIFTEYVDEAGIRYSVRNTWKYARVFDSDYFANLQTKNCVRLVFLMATMLERVDSQAQTDGNLFNIKQFESITNFDKQFLIRSAVGALAKVKRAGGRKRKRTKRVRQEDSSSDSSVATLG